MKGIGVSKGIGLGRARWLHTTPAVTAEQRRLSPADIPGELENFRAALQASVVQVKDLAATLRTKHSDEAAIFEAHVLILEDDELINTVQTCIEKEAKTAENAVNLTITGFRQVFLAMEDPLFRARAADLQDLGQRIIANLRGTPLVELGALPQGTILLADDLTPSQTAGLEPDRIAGLVTRYGGKTSHTAILANALGIPAVVGCSDLQRILEGDQVIVDGELGEVTPKPSPGQWATAEKQRAQYLRLQQRYLEQVSLPAVTSDGHRVILGANLGHPQAVSEAKEAGAEEVGLFRTEFLYLGRITAPSEDEQFAAYRSVVEKMEGCPVIFRTLDAGGDKQIPYLAIPKEDNPFLGYRALRISLQEPELFRAQIRALLRASTFGPVRIMFPMVATLDELREAKQLVIHAGKELRREGHALGTIEIGIMVEIPAAAIQAADFAQEADFFSIGTNDLVQYTLAADRLNPQLSGLYQNYNPAVLRLIDQVVKGAHRYGKRVGVCGEMAGQLSGAVILLGLGVNELSMSPVVLPEIKSLIRATSWSETRELASRLLQLKTVAEVEAAIQDYFAQKDVRSRENA